MHTLEIAGRPVAIINLSEDEAEAEFTGEAFKSDLMVLEAGGQPLWDGEAELFVRRSQPEEVASFERSFAKAMRDGGADRKDEVGYLAFLVPVTDPTDDDHEPDDHEPQAA